MENILSNYFPYEPYECQSKFIEKIYTTLLSKKAGIFESPTGTGKSLSILCGVLKYLDYLRTKDNLKIKKDKNETDDWLSSFGNNSNDISNKSNNIFIKKLDDPFTKFNFDPKKRKLPEIIAPTNLNKIPIEGKKFKYDNSNQDSKDDIKKMLINENLLIESTQVNNDKNKQKNSNSKIQIFYCTRTHSQISQVISEIKKIKDNFIKKTINIENFSYYFTSIGSRKLLCINPNVNTNSSNINQINEKCIDLIQSDASSKCQFYNTESIESLSAEINRKVYDIEDLNKLGLDISACPYFSSRKAMDDSDIIVLPYNSIINGKIRKSLNIELENKIIIFDEAHNLVENILQTYNGELKFDNLVLILFGLNLYYETYNTRLKSSSNMYLRQIIKIVENFMIFTINNNISKDPNKIHSLSEISIDLDVANMNIFKLLNFIEICELHNKIKWMLEKYIKENVVIGTNKKIEFENKNEKINLDIETNNNNSILSIFRKYISKLNIADKHKDSFFYNLNFENLKKQFYLNSSDLLTGLINVLSGMTYINEDGKIILEELPSLFNINKTLLGKIKFIMINPCREFDHILKYSKCVIFAGGTMKPLEEFDLLLKVLKKDEIEYFQGSHVVDKSNILVSNITIDFTKYEKLIFNHENFTKKENFMLESILNIVNFHLEKQIFQNKTGKGIVVFLHTYAIIEKIQKFNNKIKIIENYKILYEEKGSDYLFNKYTENINKNNITTVLFAVIGGRLSEGINFSDDLARIVLVFGLPYPNIASEELKIKMNYYDSLYKKGESSINGEEYYENICMKAVNQSIGRSIRHINDYAAIVLVDTRYSRDRIKNKLPSWILNTSNYKTVKSENCVYEYKDSLIEFFKNK